MRYYVLDVRFFIKRLRSNKLVDKNKNLQKVYQHKVLIVEDNESIQDLIFRVLKHYSITADLASNGKEALEIFIKDPEYYDIIFMDVRMPIMDGHTASLLIREEMKEKKVRIIGMSANQFSKSSESSMKMIFDNTIKKPFQFNDLETIFEKYPI